MAVGNAVGSNIFNILMVLGIASAINPVSLIRENVIDIIILVVFSVVVWIFAATKKKISRKEGIAMVAMYLAYAVYIILHDKMIPGSKNIKARLGALYERDLEAFLYD